MKKGLVLTAVLGKVALATALVLGMALVGCDNGSTSSGSGSNGGGGGGGNPFIGTWYGTAPGPCYITLTIAGSTWTQTQTGAVTGSSSGTYTYSYTNASFTVGTVSGLGGYVTVGSTWSASISGSALNAGVVIYTRTGSGGAPDPSPDPSPSDKRAG